MRSSQLRDWLKSLVPFRQAECSTYSWTLHDPQKKAHDPFGGHNPQFGNQWIKVSKNDACKLITYFDYLIMSIPIASNIVYWWFIDEFDNNFL